MWVELYALRNAYLEGGRMTVHQDFISLDDHYRRTTGDKIILNDLSFTSLDNMELVNNSLMTVYDNDVISTVPTCDCSKYNKRYYVNRVCEQCGTVVMEPYQKQDPILWMKALDGHKFFNPHFWLMVKELMSSTIDGLRYLSDSTYNPPVRIPAHVQALRDILQERSYNKVVNNIDTILIYMKNHAKYKQPNHQQTIDELLDLYTRNKNKLFSTYMPIPNKRLFVMENTSKGKFTNLTVSDMINVVGSWVKTCSSHKLTPVKVNNITAATVSKIASFYKSFYSDFVAHKTGSFRKHVYGTRSHFTFRCVIVSIPGRHNYDEIHVPWAIGPTVFRPHLLNKLVKQRGFTYRKANQLLYLAVKKYIPLIDELLQELIDESPRKGIDVIMQRNQTMGSIQGKPCLNN